MLTLTHVWLCAIVMYTASAQYAYLNLTEGQVCHTNGSTCKYIEDCPKFINELTKTVDNALICNFIGESPVVCCEPGENLPETLRKRNSPLPLGTKTRESDVCGGDGSTCKSILDCPKAINDLKRTGKTPKTCSFTGNHPHICCEPEENLPPPGTKCKEMCKTFAKSVVVRHQDHMGNGYYEEDRCSRPENSRVVGGSSEAVPKEFPHMALIGYGSNYAKQWLSGGSLISERFVLSAAHCSSDRYNRPAEWVLLGVYNRMSLDVDDQNNSRPTLYQIVERIDHPGYQERSLYHDIALFRLDRDVEFNEYIRPICLHTDSAVSMPYAIVTGWVRSETNDPEIGVLQKVNVGLTPKEQCRAFYNGIGGPIIEQLKYGVFDEKMFCAGDAQRDTCQGLSGGPMQLKLTVPYCMYSQIGIFSFGKNCAQRPGVYTRVSNYISWIESIVWP